MDRIPSQPDLARPAAFPGAPRWSSTAAQDWAATPLGPVESWPQSLKTAASMVLGSTVPMFVGWGPDLLLLYNDGYAEILGDRGPALGQAGARDLGRRLGADPAQCRAGAGRRDALLRIGAAHRCRRDGRRGDRSG